MDTLLAGLCADARTKYAKTFLSGDNIKENANPIVVAFAPGRVNLIGEHTDYNDGFVLPMTVPMFTVVAGQRRCWQGSSGDPEPKHVRVHIKSFSIANDADAFLSLSLDAHTRRRVEEAPLPSWAKFVLGVCAVFKGPLPSFDAVVVSSVPLGGGLSSSASLLVALYEFVHAISGGGVDKVSDNEKARLCLRVEREFVGVDCGIMDQSAVIAGRAEHCILLDCRSLKIKFLPLNDPSIAVLVINTNVKHSLEESEYNERREACRRAAHVLGVSSLRDVVTLEKLQESKGKFVGAELEILYHRARHVICENFRTLMAADALGRRDYATFGRLMYESHASLRDDFEVSCAELDALVELASTFDANVGGIFGARLTGGGFGGCTVTLLKAASVTPFTAYVREAAATQQLSFQPTFYVCRPVRGAGVEFSLE